MTAFVDCAVRVVVLLIECRRKKSMGTVAGQFDAGFQCKVNSAWSEAFYVYRSGTGAAHDLRPSAIEFGIHFVAFNLAAGVERGVHTDRAAFCV